MNVEAALKKVRSEVSQNVKIVAVSKTKPPELLMRVYNEGHKIFGENKVQELVDKYQILPKDIEWHLIGHLQTNKVKYIVPFIHLIHSVDSIKLLKVINSEALKINRIIHCLLQVRIAREETKFGLTAEQLNNIITSSEFQELKNVSVDGLMGMATFCDDDNIIRSEFRKLYTIFKELRQGEFKDKSDFNQLSMGMSGDYLIAIEEGSTMVRIGSLIFGERNYI